ncbi:MAG: YgeY family selenium metabolism-linked hydrolase [Anaerolineales bacterium]|nr:MAG: YgeY family selenium metabolism-linked hydrolase [Anaerolineales bacterium]
MFNLSSQDRDALIGFLQDLVRTPSPSTQEGEVAQRLVEEMQRVGFAEVTTDRIGNVIGRIGSGRGSKLLYNGHMDTVDVTDPGLWPCDPYGAEIEEGVLYGLGACDMKGALAAMVYGVKALVDADVELGGDLYVVGVVQEEPCEGLAMRVLVEEEGLRPDLVVLGEATNLQISCGQRGRIELKVTARGRSCHASAPEHGENAIYAAARLIFGVELLAPRLADDAFLGQGSLSITQIESTAASRNAVPDRCTFYIDRRLTMGETEAKALAEIQSIIVREGVKAEVEVTEYRATSHTGYQCQSKEYYPAWVMAEDHPLVQAVARAVKQTLGYKPRVGKWDFSTDGVYTMGVAGIPTVGLGPGEERYLHTVNDQVRLADVVKAAQVYAQLAVEVIGAR